MYSTWSDNDLRSYLEDKGVIKTKTQSTRDELLAKMKESYASVANPAWEAWSDSYIVRIIISGTSRSLVLQILRIECFDLSSSPGSMTVVSSAPTLRRSAINSPS